MAIIQYAKRDFEVFCPDLGIKDFKPSEFRRHYDIELTNHCNTSCIFCPRDAISRKGYIDENTFEKAVQKIEEAGYPSEITICGVGEPLLHPMLANFISYLSDRGHYSNLKTNAFLLDEKTSQKLMYAGLNHLGPSISHIDEAYFKIHRLDFNVVKSNLMKFLEISEGKCEVTLSITLCDENENDIEKLVEYWEDLGVKRFLIYDNVNRGGALDKNYNFSGNSRYQGKAQRIMAENRIDPICLLPYIVTYIGWDGGYYMCTSDFDKKHSLGHVKANSIEEVDLVKKKLLSEGHMVCRDCDISIANRIREMLCRHETGNASFLELKNLIEYFQTLQENQKQLRRSFYFHKKKMNVKAF